MSEHITSFFGLLLLIACMAISIFAILSGLYCVGLGYYQSLKVRASRKDLRS